MKQKLPKDWERFIKEVEKILQVHAIEIALKAVQVLHFGKVYHKKRRKSTK